MSSDKIDSIVSRHGSTEEFLNFLAEGKWVARKKDLPEPVKKEIIREKTSQFLARPSLLEANLEEFIMGQLDHIEDGLELVARQKVIDVGRIDLLCKDKDGNCVVIELKRMKATSSIMDQILRYMGWIQAHQVDHCRGVRGIIIVGKKDTYLEYAAKVVPNLEVKEFSITIK